MRRAIVQVIDAESGEIMDERTYEAATGEITVEAIWLALLCFTVVDGLKSS